MKVLVVLALALACASAASIYDTPVLPRDLVLESEIDGRITNGQTASAGQFPYQAGLSLSTSSGSFWCGGSLIGSNWVLTAAHCTDGVTSAKVYLGSTTRTVAKVTHTVSSSDIHQHADYNSKTLANDISLIKIPSVSYTSEIKAIKLPSIASSYSTYSGSYAIASGWGRTSDSKLKKVKTKNCFKILNEIYFYSKLCFFHIELCPSSSCCQLCLLCYLRHIRCNVQDHLCFHPQWYLHLPR